MRKTIQKILIVLTVLSLLLGIVAGSGFIFLALAALPIGITQYMGSFMDVLEYRRKSKFFGHLIWSTVALMVVIGLYNSAISTGPLVIAAIVSLVCLPIYYWVLIFDSEWDKKDI